MPLEDLQNEAVPRSLVFELVGDLLVMCLGSADPPNRDWEQWVERCSRVNYRGTLIASAGGAPNSRQRARVAEVLADVARPPPLALLTDSAVLRHVMTAFSWLLGQKRAFRAFPSAAIADAVQWLGVDVPAARVLETLARLRSAVATTARGEPVD